MKAIDERNLVLKIIDYGLKHDVFLPINMYKDLNINENDKYYIFRNLVSFEHESSPNHILTTETKYGAGRSMNDFEAFDNCRVLPTAIFSYIDHLEIIEARKSAREAKKLSWIAIWISSIIGLLSLLVSLLQLWR